MPTGLGLLADSDGGNSDNSDSDWQPRIRKTALAGTVQEGKVVTPFQWPKRSDVQELPLNDKIKLCSLGIKANTNLY